MSNHVRKQSRNGLSIKKYVLKKKHQLVYLDLYRLP
jgi:hypothetical protein